MGRVQNSDCGVMPATFFEKLASCARIDEVSGDIYINTICYYLNCEDAESPIQCADPALLDAEQFCADNFFALDSCGHLALKLNVCEKLMDEF